MAPSRSEPAAYDVVVIGSGVGGFQVRASGQPHKLGRFPFSANSRAKLQHGGEGFVKVISSTRLDHPEAQWI